MESLNNRFSSDNVKSLNLRYDVCGESRPKGGGRGLDDPESVFEKSLE